MSQTITTRPPFLTARTLVYDAWDLRSAVENAPGAGVEDYESFRVKQRAAGANMSVDVGVTNALMRAWVRGSTRTGQGLYLVDNIERTFPSSSSYGVLLNHAVTANASGNPRLDQVILRVEDSQHAGANNQAIIDVLAGTPTGGATLDNRNGAATLPASCILLADILVANGAATIVTADIRDRRPFSQFGHTPPLLTDVERALLQPAPAAPARWASITHAANDLWQAAVAVYLPRRIVAATRLRWRYRHQGTAMTGSYVFAIFDASGRKIVDTGSVAWTGALNTHQIRSETIAATTLEPGWYYLFFGNDSGAGGVDTIAAGGAIASTGLPAAGPDVYYGANSGGLTVPTTILAFTDLGVFGTDLTAMPVPLATLTVG